MTLDIPKRGRGRPKKMPDCTEEVAKAIRDWEQPERNESININFGTVTTILVIIMFLELTALIIAATGYLVVRI